MTAFVILTTALATGVGLLLIAPMVGRNARRTQRGAHCHRQAAAALVLLRKQLAEFDNDEQATATRYARGAQ